MLKRRVLIAALAALTVTPLLLAQAPKGWKMRVDRSTSASDPDASGSIKFMQMGSVLHAVNPQAAVFWNPANTATGNYTLKGTFTLMKPSGHTNYYGLVFGGSDLEGAAAELHSTSWSRRTARGSSSSAPASATSDVARRRRTPPSRSPTPAASRSTRSKCASAPTRSTTSSTARSCTRHRRPAGQDRRHLRHPRQPSARSAGRRTRGYEVVHGD